MSSLEQYSSQIIIVLLILVVLLLAVVLVLLKIKRVKSHSNDGVNAPTGYARISQDELNDILRERNRLRGECKKSGSSNSGIPDYYNEYEKAREEIGKLENENAELTREIHELNALIEQYKKEREETATIERQERNSTPSKNIPQVMRYASFPRSAGSNSYFSDLTLNLADDSYFELRVSDGTGEATFKPLDFMKIRNYDPAMAAMVTEGVKPNVASTILNIEPGKAHLDGKDWIIDKPAIIKLA